MNRNRNVIIAVLAFVAILFAVWLYIPKAQLTIRSNPETIILQIDGKQSTLQNGQSIRLRAGTYPYIATQAGYTTSKGFLSVRDSSSNELSIELRKLTVIEKEYPEALQKYPNTNIAAEYQPQSDWLVVQLVSTNDVTKKTLLILRKTAGQWQIAATGQDFVTPIQIADAPQTIQNWLAENNFVSSSNTDEGVD